MISTTPQLSLIPARVARSGWIKLRAALRLKWRDA
jgi:hypothetical protein